MDFVGYRALEIKNGHENPPREHNVKQENGLEQRLGVANVLTYLLNVGYYLCVVPRKIDFSKERGFFQRKTWIVQQIVCATLHVLSLYHMHTTLEPLSRKIPIVWFQRSYLNLLRITYRYYILKRLWFNGSGYLKVVQCLITEKHLPIAWASKNAGFWMVQVYGTYLLITFCNFCLEFSFDCPATTKSDFLNILAFVALNFGKLADSLLTTFSHLLLLSLVSTLWLVASAFAQSVKKDTESWTEHRLKFRSLDYFSKKVDNALGFHTKIFLMYSLIYCSIYPPALVCPHKWITTWTIWFFALVGVILYLSGKIHIGVNLLHTKIKFKVLRADDNVKLTWKEADQYESFRKIGIWSSGTLITPGFIGNYVWMLTLLFLYVLTEINHRAEGTAASANFQNSSTTNTNMGIYIFGLEILE